MATVVSTPVLAYNATLFAGGFNSHGQSQTMTVQVTGNWELQLPVGVLYGSNVSLPAVVNIYPSSDGGANFASIPLLAFSITTVASKNQIVPVRLTTGLYAITVTSSSPSTTVYALTSTEITAVANN